MKTDRCSGSDAEEEVSEAEVRGSIWKLCQQKSKFDLISIILQHMSVGKGGFEDPEGYSGVHAAVITAKKNFLN